MDLQLRSYRTLTPSYRIVTLALVALLLGAAHACAQTGIGTSGGRAYVVAFPDTTTNIRDARWPDQAYQDRAYVMIYSAIDAHVSVRGRTIDTSLQIAAGRFALVALTNSSGTLDAGTLVTEHCRPVSSTFRISADAPVIVYQYMVTRFGAEAWTPQPVESWGSEYYAAAHPGEVLVDIAPGSGANGWRGRRRMAPAEIIVVAAYDDTRITIVPNGQMLDFCRAENVTLKAGEAYSVQSYVDTLTANAGQSQPDFGGSRIFSTKPVGVISANTRAELIASDTDLGQNSFRNMLVEALAPVEQHGTEFAYLPTWDAHTPTGGPFENPDEMRRAEIVRVYGTSAAPTGGVDIGNGIATPFASTIAIARFLEFQNIPVVARVYRTDHPAQVTMSTTPTVVSAASSAGGAAYDVWGGSMVTLVPREQWVSLAPFMTPGYPGLMDHFVNVVTDSAHRRDVKIDGATFPLDRPIAGTDLVWGSMAIAAGTSHVLTGANGAVFTGNVYGSRAGHEEMRPAGNAYEEYLGIAYDYPLAGRNRFVGPGDSLRIRTVQSCGPDIATRLDVYIETVNEDPSGLRSVVLDSAINARIAGTTPEPFTGAVTASVSIVTIDRTRDASGVVVITDRSGKETRIPFRALAERVTIDPVAVSFGIVTPGAPVQRSVVLGNPLDRTVDVSRIRLVSGNQSFSIVTPPTLPVAIGPGESLTLTIEANPTQSSQRYVDTLAIDLECSTWKVPLRVETATPCLRVGDLDFGMLAPGESRTLPLELCNDGGGLLTFGDSTGSVAALWRVPGFSVPPGQLRMLRDTALARDMCVTIEVTYTATAEGVVADTAHIISSGGTCRSISLWSARVARVGSAAEIAGTATSLMEPEPNPAGSTTIIRFRLARAEHATIVLFDVRGRRVATLLDEDRAAGAHALTLDAGALAPGIYHYRLSAGGVECVRALVRR